MKIGEAAEVLQDGSKSSRPGAPLRVQRAIRSTVMTIAKTMTPPIPAAVANATGVRAETVVLNPFHSASHTAHRSRGIGDMRSPLRTPTTPDNALWRITVEPQYTSGHAG